MPSSGTRRRRMTREEKTSQTRLSIINAAIRVIGECGYSEASIANITREADVALGTFYMHFESKKALFDELLLWSGSQAHTFMNGIVEGAETQAEFEARNFDALVEFVRQNPGYLRLLSETEVASPEAYQEHIDRSIVRYAEALQAAHDRGELPDYDEDEIELIATMLTSMKLLLFRRFSTGRGPSPVMRKTYLKFVLTALSGEKPEELPENRVARKRR